MSKRIDLRDRIILALDVDNPQKAREWVRMTEEWLGFYKVGLQLFMADWFNIVDWITARGHKVMVDLKFFDIPETVRLAVEQLRGRKVSLATIHGNDAIIRAAMRAVEGGGDERLRILAVTVLTSFDDDDLRAMGLRGSVQDLVLRRARRALELGCDGVVSSGMEAERLRDQLGEKLLVVTPGIRPGANIEERGDDQKRVMTPARAIAAGADHLVVGRPVTQAPDPGAVIRCMQDEVRAALT